MRHLLAGLIAAIALTTAACGGDTPTEGPVTIETDADLVSGIGTFTVTEGADILGCSAGTVQGRVLDDFGIRSTPVWLESIRKSRKPWWSQRKWKTRTIEGHAG